MPLDKTFRAFAPDQMLLMPQSLDDWLPKAWVSSSATRYPLPIRCAAGARPCGPWSR